MPSRTAGWSRPARHAVVVPSEWVGVRHCGSSILTPPDHAMVCVRLRPIPHFGSIPPRGAHVARSPSPRRQPSSGGGGRGGGARLVPRSSRTDLGRGHADMLPTFFIIGATRAGTTSLAQYLASHPEVHMSPYKEPHFFVEPGDGLPSVADRIGTLPAYERLFVTDLPVRGEASTSYSHFPARRGVPERIHAMVPAARILYLVRD